MTTVKVKPLKPKLSCRLCKSRDLNTVLDLGISALANEYPDTDTNPPQEYPLRLKQCGDCGHVQLAHVVDKKILFDNYLYISGTSPSFINHFKEYAEETLNTYCQFAGEVTNKNINVLEIGSNDGTLMFQYQKRNCRVIGVEPARNLALQCRKNGLKIENTYFNKDLVNKFLKNGEQFDIITANNVMAHIDDLDTIFTGIKRLLSENGFFVFEVSYLPEVIKNLLFDTIYHEHVDYHHLKPLIKYLNKFGLRLFDARMVATHGGSIRIYVSNVESSYVSTYSLEKIVKAELVEKRTFDEMNLRIQTAKFEFQSKLNNLKRKGYSRLIAYGVPAKFTTFSYQFNLSKELVNFAIDDSPLKQGKFTPGKLIPILSFRDAGIKKDDVVLISAWNFHNEIKLKLRDIYKGSGLMVIVPLPRLNVIKL